MREISLGLISLGVGRGDKVAILGDNRPAWICAELAAQSAGAASVGIYQDSNLNEVAYVIDHCDAKVVIAEDQEQVDKILEMIDRLPKILAVVYDDPRGLRSYKHPLLMSLDSLKERVVPLHEICQNEQPFLSSQGDHFIGLAQIHRQRFFANDVLSGLKGLHCLRMVEKGRSRNIDQVDVIPGQQGIRVLQIRNSKPLGHRKCRLAVRRRHAHQFDAGNLGELLERKKTEAPGAEGADPYPFRFHRLASVWF